MKINFMFRESLRGLAFTALAIAGLLVPIVEAQAAATSLRADGTILLNNTPFYPFGFYFDGYNIPKPTRLADLPTIANAGFNVIATNIDNADGALFTSCANLNLGVLMEFNDGNDTIVQQVNTWKSNPALFGWQVADDADNGQKTPAGILAIHNSIKAADSSHITYASAGHPTPGAGHGWVGDYMGVSDTIAMQTYPVPEEDLSATNATLKALFNAAPANKSLLANCQSFKWDGERAPNADEVRNMTYQAYINGMKGIIFYTFRSDDWNLQTNSGLWSQFQELADENAIMRPWLLNGQMTRQVDTGAQRFNVFCSYWGYQGKIYIMLANVTGSGKNTTVTLPVGTTGPALSLFLGTPSGMTFNNGTRELSGTVQGHKVHVYQLNNPSASVNDWALYD